MRVKFVKTEIPETRDLSLVKPYSKVGLPSLLVLMMPDDEPMTQDMIISRHIIDEKDRAILTGRFVSFFKSSVDRDAIVEVENPIRVNTNYYTRSSIMDNMSDRVLKSALIKLQELNLIADTHKNQDKIFLDSHSYNFNIGVETGKNDMVDEPKKITKVKSLSLVATILVIGLFSIITTFNREMAPKSEETSPNELRALANTIKINYIHPALPKPEINHIKRNSIVPKIGVVERYSSTPHSFTFEPSTVIYQMKKEQDPNSMPN